MIHTPTLSYRASKWLGLCGLILAGFLPVRPAHAGEMAFEVKITPKFPSGYDIAIKNETREPISGITLSIGSTTSRFLKLESVTPGGRILEPVTDPGDTGVVREEWWNLNSEYTIASFYNQTGGFTTSPQVRTLATGTFETPSNVRDRYGVRMRGYFIPSVSGNYRFWISSDDNGELYIDGNSVAIASVPQWSSSRQWDKFPSQQSAPQALTAGQRYLITAFMKEVGGGDNLAVGITLPNGVLERPVKASRFSTVSASGVPLPRPAPIISDIPSELIRITEINGNSGVALGQTLLIRGVFQQDRGNAAQLLWNNGSQPNAVLTVFGAQGSRSELTIPDTDENRSDITYTFLSDARPRTLTVNSRTTSSQPGLFVSNFYVSVRNADGALIEERTNNTTDVTIDYLVDGNQVEISAVEEVYLNAAGRFLYDSTSIPAEEGQSATNAPRQRYVATGLSVNNTPQTGDPTQYTFDMNGDAAVNLRWRHDYALLVNHDFSRTASDEITPSGTPWAGPLSSEASGNPEPQATTINWIEKGESVLAQIDGAVLDFTRPGLDIRYVPSGYQAEGSARGVFTENSVYTKSFNVGQQPAQRQQVDAFTMNGWGSITYDWQIQYGVRINVDDASRSALPRVFQTGSSGQLNEVGALEGVFWFNPNTPVTVASAASSGGLGSQALSGWVSGDGYYFQSSGDIQSSDGSLLTGIPQDGPDGPVGLWQPEITTLDGAVYRGLYIAQLKRPARVLWLYGAQVYLNTASIGQYIFQLDQTVLDNNAGLRDAIRVEPDRIEKLSVAGSYQDVADQDMAVWDPNGQKLYPVVPGEFRASWNLADGGSIMVLVTALSPATPHYYHIAGTPTVQLTPDPAGAFKFKEMKYTESEAAISEGSLFSANRAGRSVLVFGEVAQIGRGDPKEYLRVRMVQTRLWNDNAPAAGTAIIGRKITDPGWDRAKLGTGHIFFPGARYNPNIYDFDVLPELRASDVYDMTLLNAIGKEKVLLSSPKLPGPVIPVNLHPGAQPEERIVVVWYDDPALRDMIMWPYIARTYLPRWPGSETDGLGRIVMASRFGSESLSFGQYDQQVAPAGTNIVADGQGNRITNIFSSTTTFDPSRLQQAAIYVQPDPDAAGYNPNEEHALMAPSLRYAQVSPRPNAAYALRNNDLNIYNRFSSGEVGQTAEYTSHPFVLVQYFDTAINDFAMRVYRVEKEDASIDGYRFANQSLITVLDTNSQVPASPTRLAQEPYTRMEAGEPVIPFYPLGVVIGATPAPESFGQNIKYQSTYWEDHKNTSWAVSGGSNAWFTYSIYYPMQSSFWWPPNKSGRIRYDAATDIKRAAFPFTGDFVAFMPDRVSDLLATPVGSTVAGSVERASEPVRILYKSDWPDLAPVLKAGETLTFSGGEYAADNPTTLVIDDNGNVQTQPTPGLPGVLAFAVGEVVFDALNPYAITTELTNSWTVRLGQVLDVRTATLPIGDFPGTLLPANGKTRVSGGKYIFNELPASLQKRIRYNPLAQSVDENGIIISGRLEFSGLLNDKAIGDESLTAPPPAVYVLEPNIMTREDLEALMGLVDSSETRWIEAVNDLYEKSRNPNGIKKRNGDLITGGYLVGVQPQVQRDPVSGEPFTEPIEDGSELLKPIVDVTVPEPARQFGPGLALIPNGAFLDPFGAIPQPDGSSVPLPDVSWVTVAENNDPSMGGSPITLHVIKVDRRERYRGSIKTVLSDNVFDENIVLRHTADFGGNAEDVVYEWWYRPDDGALNVPPPFVVDPDSAGDWLLFPDLSGLRGRGRTEVLLKGNPNAPETLLADTWWFGRYRHKNDTVRDTDWQRPQPDGSDEVNFEWFGAGNNDPNNDFDLDGLPDYRPQLSMGWIKRVLDGVNPFEARIRDFEGDNPSTVSSMIQAFGPRYEGPVALNPAKDVIENVGLIELYETILNRAANLSINLSTPVSTPAIANALQLASTRISDFYTLLGNEAYTDAQDVTIGTGGDDPASLYPAFHAFQNMVSSPLEEELALLRGQDDFLARPVYNRMFWNFTKAEGEVAYVQTYSISDINKDGFVDEDDAMIQYPMGHGDAWGHYLMALRKQYSLLRHPYFNWVSRSEFYNLMDIVMKVDFLDERKFAQVAAAKAKAGTEVLQATYRHHYVDDPAAQWQGYTDVNEDRAWGVQGWARRAGQGAYFDWLTANALLPSVHPNEDLEGIQRVDRTKNDDIKVVSANLTMAQQIFDDANGGLNPLRLAPGAVPFDLNPELSTDLIFGKTHFEQIYERAVAALENADASFQYASESQNRLRKLMATEADFRNEVFQQDLAYRNELISIFGRPYDGTVGPGRLYPAGYDGPDFALYMYVHTREINTQTVPGPSASFATFNDQGILNGGALYAGLNNEKIVNETTADMRSLFASTFAPDSTGALPAYSRNGWFSLNYTDVDNPKVPVDQFRELMPISASGYAFIPPVPWGTRPVVGELQLLINKMLEEEADIAQAIAAWDALTGEIIRQLNLVNKTIDTLETIHDRNRDFQISKAVFMNLIKAGVGLKETLDGIEDTTTTIQYSVVEMLPKNLPTGGLAVSPGDALAPARGGVGLAGTAVQAGLNAGQVAAKLLTLASEIAFDAAETGVNLENAADEVRQAKYELLKSLEDLVGDEPVLRIAIFREIEELRRVSDTYRSLVTRAGVLVDERAAYNRRVAAKTQLNRYQDMTFRVHRNHALENYHRMLDVAARYAYLAARAYDYETNLDETDPGSPRDLYADIIKARHTGLMQNGQPRLGGGGLAEALATLKANYDAYKSQLGLNNPQFETGKMSLRTELFRILPSGQTNLQPVGNSQFPGGGSSSDALWRSTLENARVDNLWEVPEYRYFARPFASDIDASGNAAVEPGLVIRFGTSINAGENAFGLPLSGGDHAFDSSLYATRIKGVGVWFSDYLSDDVLSDLPQAPRVYLIPAGVDIMTVANSLAPNRWREWNVVDQIIPTPLAALTAELDQSRYIPLLDSLNDRIGSPRRFSSLRAYHDGGSTIQLDEMAFSTRLIGRSVWNTEWLLIIPGLTLNADPDEGLDRFIQQVTDIKLVFQTYSHAGN